MEGLFAVIFVIIGIVNFVMKQQQEQNKHQGGTGKQQPVYRTQPKYSTQPPRKPAMERKPVMDMKDFWNEGMQGAAESEGLEAEDRNRTGSLDYIEQSQSLEGECDEHPVHLQKRKKEQEIKPVPRTVIPETEEGIVVELTEEHLLSSFIMSEIIGPPRALKRSIR